MIVLTVVEAGTGRDHRVQMRCVVCRQVVGTGGARGLACSMPNRPGGREWSVQSCLLESAECYM